MKLPHQHGFRALRAPLKPLQVLCLLVASYGVSNLHGQAQETSKKPAGDSPQCLEYYKLIAKTHSDLPKSYRSLSKARLAELGEASERALNACQEFLSSCSTSEKVPEVQYYYGHFLYILSRRYEQTIKPTNVGRDPESIRKSRDELKARMANYYGRISAYARSAYEKLPKSSPLKAKALELCGRGEITGARYADARKTFETFMKLYPGHKDTGSVVSSLGRILLNLKEYDKGIDLVEKMQKEKVVYNSSSYPYMGELLWKLNEAKGDLAGMLTAVEGIRTVYPMRMKGSGLTQYMRDDFERYLIFSGFRRGYVLFAMGDYSAATAAFDAHIKELGEIEARLVKEKKALPPYADIYRKRSMDCIDFIDRLVDQPAPADFDLEGLWVTPKSSTLNKLAGKVVALVFRGCGDRRSAPFVENVSLFCAEDPDIEMVSISYLKGSREIPEQMDKLRRELEQMGYTGAAGFDPDASQKKLFKAYKANVGSATFIAIDGRGNLGWFQQDPRSVDVNMATAILKRIADEL